MLPNPFGWFLDVIVDSFRKVPRISTWFAALFMSATWTFSWLFAFFLATWLLDIETSVANFLVMFWIAIAAETLTRWAENTNFVFRLSRPRLPKDTPSDGDFRWSTAIGLLAISIAGAFFLHIYLTKSGLRDSSVLIAGQGGVHSYAAIQTMLNRWLVALYEQNTMAWLLLGTLLRAKIYLRTA